MTVETQGYVVQINVFKLISLTELYTPLVSGRQRWTPCNTLSVRGVDNPEVSAIKTIKFSRTPALHTLIITGHAGVGVISKLANWAVTDVRPSIFYHCQGTCVSFKGYVTLSLYSILIETSLKGYKSVAAEENLPGWDSCN